MTAPKESEVAKAAEAKPTNSPATGQPTPSSPAGATATKVADAPKPAVQSDAPKEPSTPSPAGGPTGGSENGTDAGFEAALNEPDLVPVPTDRDLDGLDETVRNAHDAVAILVLDTVGHDTKDSFIVWGYGGKMITLGDLRTIARDYRSRNA